MAPIATNKVYGSQAFCTAVIGSTTAAIKAQRALSGAAIRADVVKVSYAGGRGCEYGVRFPRALSGNAAAILESKNISVLRYE